MGILETIGAYIVKQVTQEVVKVVKEEIRAFVTEVIWTQKNNAKYDKEAAEIYEQAKHAKTLAEKDALLDKLFNSRPKFE